MISIIVDNLEWILLGIALSGILIVGVALEFSQNLIGRNQMLEGIEKLEKRVAALEARFPSICPDPTGEGSAWQGGSIGFRIPTGWVERLFDSLWAASDRNFNGLHIYPDPSIPWGEGYEAILPEEAREGDEYRTPCGWTKKMTKIEKASGVAWRRRKSPAPAEPAPGSDAEHPPVGYRLAKVGETRAPWYIFWSEDRQKWIAGEYSLFGVEIDLRFSAPIANPIPANEGDSQKEVSELRATVERLTAENTSLEVENRTLRGLVRRMREVLL